MRSVDGTSGQAATVLWRVPLLMVLMGAAFGYRFGWPAIEATCLVLPSFVLLVLDIPLLLLAQKKELRPLTEALLLSLVVVFLVNLLVLFGPVRAEIGRLDASREKS